MAEEVKNKQEKETMKEQPKDEKKVETSKVETKEGNEIKKEEKTQAKQEKKKEVTKVVVKDKAIANAFALQISPKYTKAICKMIRRKSPDRAVIMLEQVVKGKLPVKMHGLEVPHKKGKGIAGARFPKTAAQAVLGVVQQLKANALVNGIEEPIISIAMSNQASAPFRRGGRKAKRTNLHLEAIDKTKFKMMKK